jgi:hypothetical protein
MWRIKLKVSLQFKTSDEEKVGHEENYETLVTQPKNLMFMKDLVSRSLKLAESMPLNGHVIVENDRNNPDFFAWMCLMEMVSEVQYVPRAAKIKIIGFYIEEGVPYFTIKDQFDEDLFRARWYP